MEPKSNKIFGSVLLPIFLSETYSNNREENKKKPLNTVMKHITSCYFSRHMEMAVMEQAFNARIH